MTDRRRSRRSWLALTVGAVLVVAACQTQTAAPTNTVLVYATWGGTEQDNFLAMVKPWEDQNSAEVGYLGSRGLGTILTTGIATNTLPDLSGLPSPGEMAEFAKGGHLVDLDTVLDGEKYRAETPKAFVDLGTVDGKLVGIFMKVSPKGFIWYNPKVYTGGQPTSWDDMMAKGKAAAQANNIANVWCVGFESAADSGWPGTDWIEDIVLRESGPDVYDKWVAGEQKWTSPEIKSAFQRFGTILDDTYGGANTINSTNFGNGGDALFTSPPNCVFHHQASFITGFFQDNFPDVVAGTDYDYFFFPDINPQNAGALEGSGDLFGMFKKTDLSASLMNYLVTADAQAIWAKAGGGFIPSNKTVPADVYPDDITRKQAAATGEAQIFRFDGGDLMPAELKAAFFKAMVDFAADQSQLDAILQRLDETSASARQ
jgi:alpha-glucoside transport system substrate-binding protein